MVILQVLYRIVLFVLAPLFAVSVGFILLKLLSGSLTRIKCNLVVYCSFKCNIMCRAKTKLYCYFLIFFMFYFITPFYLKYNGTTTNSVTLVTTQQKN